MKKQVLAAAVALTVSAIASIAHANSWDACGSNHFETCTTTKSKADFWVRPGNAVKLEKGQAVVYAQMRYPTLEADDDRAATQALITSLVKKAGSDSFIQIMARTADDAKLFDKWLKEAGYHPDHYLFAPAEKASSDAIGSGYGSRELVSGAFVQDGAPHDLTILVARGFAGEYNRFRASSPWPTQIRSEIGVSLDESMNPIEGNQVILTLVANLPDVTDPIEAAGARDLFTGLKAVFPHPYKFDIYATLSPEWVKLGRQVGWDGVASTPVTFHSSGVDTQNLVIQLVGDLPSAK